MNVKRINKQVNIIIFISIICFNQILLLSPLEDFIFQFNSNNLILASGSKSYISELPPINYDSFYYNWYYPKIEMLIIPPNNESFINSLRLLQECKNNKGVKTLISNDFYNYPGNDKSEKIRNLVAHYYNNEEIKWVLLVGDASEDLIPIRYVYNPDTIEYDDDEYYGHNNYYKPTDFYRVYPCLMVIIRNKSV